ncbi:hypothetical protein ABBQ38_011499 [Trebouxia sp. C0009 RCD-2024]
MVPCGRLPVAVEEPNSSHTSSPMKESSDQAAANQDLSSGLNRRQRKAAKRAALRRSDTPADGSSCAEHSNVVADLKEADPVLSKNPMPEVSGSHLNKRDRKAAKRAASKASGPPAENDIQEGTGQRRADGQTQETLLENDHRHVSSFDKSQGVAQRQDTTTSTSAKNVVTKKAVKKGAGSTSTSSQSPKNPKTPPQDGPQAYSTWTRGSSPSSTSSHAKMPRTNNTKSTQPTDVIKNMNRHSTAKSTGQAFAGQNPLVGNRIDFGHHISHIELNVCTRLASKLKTLRQFSTWRPISGFSPDSVLRGELSFLVLPAGDGNCAYRAMLIGLLEAAAIADDSSRRSLVQQIDLLYKQLPEWARSSFSRTSNVAFGYGMLKALLINKQKWSMEEVVAVCCSQMESDSMLLFLKAIIAANMAANELMEIWQFEIRPKLPMLYRGWSLQQMVRICVLPLAGPRSDVLWGCRFGGHTELGVLANALGSCSAQSSRPKATLALVDKAEADQSPDQAVLSMPTKRRSHTEQPLRYQGHLAAHPSLLSPPGFGLITVLGPAAACTTLTAGQGTQADQLDS